MPSMYFMFAVNVQRRFNGRLPLVMSLMQVYRRYDKLEGIGLYAIGFEIFQVRIKLLITSCNISFFKS